ncbi:PAS domain-containing protein [Amantichitinum ursilacus]|uniref:PAS domain-containing protein n=1 Tax=Amantichitinum ursilacus TaxID=857265 RepID=A0A0N1JSB6_9NEIS|nr:PAS domain-containing protein [Amantichitinum ursilacus]KPC52588.1 hypothetical protein WG78_12110 [Amantichitinum ursilacus]
MAPHIDWDARRQGQRHEAEAMVASLSPQIDVDQPSAVLAHELLVHKIELEMQIAELQQANSAIEVACDRYQELYDDAPYGYITLDTRGAILEGNRNAAALLGKPIDTLTQTNFVALVLEAQADRWLRFLQQMKESKTTENADIVLPLHQGDSVPRIVYISCRRACHAFRTDALRLSLTDVNAIKQAEAEMFRSTSD